MHSKNRSLSSIFFNNMLIISIFLGLMVAAIFIFFEVREFNKDAEKAREEGLTEKKQLVKSEVEKVINYIHFTRLFMEKRMRRNIKSRVNEAWSIIDNIYQQNAGRLSDEQILELIKNALRPVRFYNGRGYYFIVRLNGIEELYPVKPDMEGENLLDLQDAKGNYVIKEEIKKVREHEAGFVKGYWHKPHADSTRMFEKTSFVKRYKPLNIYVGCGDYLDNVRKDIQRDVKKRIKRTQFGQYGYVFVYSYNGIEIINDSDEHQPGDTVWELEDPNGVKVIQEAWKVVNRKGGGFIRYSWNKPGTDKVAPKISYIKGIDEWQWMIGAGVYINEIENEIAQQRELLYYRMLRKGGVGLLLIILVLGGVYYITRKNSAMIQQNFRVFINELRTAVKNGKMMNSNDYSISDLQNIIPPVNEVIQDKANTQAKLKESEVRFRTIFENIPIMLLVFNNANNITFRNKEFNKKFDLHSGFKVHLYKLLKQLPNTEKNKAFIKSIINCDGIFREIEVNTNTGKETHNWACFRTGTNETILVGSDITPMRRQQEKLQISNETKDKVLSVISHDLHGPFNTIIGFSNILLQNRKKLSAQKEERYLSHIHNSSKAMHTMLTNLLSWARAQSGNIKLYIAYTEASFIITEVIRILSPLAAQKNIEIKNMVASDLILYTDASLLRIVLQNLVTNGIKFTHKGGQVNLSAHQQQNGDIEIIVADNGIGMPPEMVRQFNSGKKIKAQKGTNNESGTGLGLLICKEFAEYLNGSITVTSKQGEGSSFKIRLPKAQKEKK